MEFELNLEFLRRKRVKRTGVKKNGHVWQLRTMSIMERATRKFPSDMALWMQYAELARKQRSFKKLSKIVTSMVRLHTAEPQAWIYAATYAMSDLGDSLKARAYMQRGLRFCRESQAMWLEYARLEMSYLAKLQARRDILGLDKQLEVTETAVDDEDADVIALQVVTAGEMIRAPAGDDDDNAAEVAKDLAKTPVMSGAIPMAIFDAAMAHFKDAELGERFFDMVSKFGALPCSHNILQHIVDHLTSTFPTEAVTSNVLIRQKITFIDPTTSAFPRALFEALVLLDAALKERQSTELVVKSLQWILPCLTQEELDPDIQEVLTITSTRLLQSHLVQEGTAPRKQLTTLLHSLYSSHPSASIRPVIEEASRIWPEASLLQQIQAVQAAHAVQ